MKKRASGILLHITSLPSPYGIGDFGKGAYRFADFLKKSGQKYWQILPLNLTDLALASSPYSSCSAFAGNTLFISPEILLKDGFLQKSDLENLPKFSEGRVDYHKAALHKTALLHKAFANSKKNILRDADFKTFQEKNKFWLEDYAVFAALKKHFAGASWVNWPEEIRNRDQQALEKCRQELDDVILREKFFQFLFLKQWFTLKQYCNNKGIQIIGDLPFYVQHDSADVWTHQHIFKIDKAGNPLGMAGVPPDYFSETGQLWGNPVYRWDALKKERYQWWKERLAQNFNFFDIVRIDHFRGFVAFWEVPQGEKTAIKGQWVKVPVEDFFEELIAHFKTFPIIAEDLGVITDGVKEIIKKYDFPGMKILAFAFDGKEDNPYLPQNYIKNCLVYTGTHDNNTTQGWFKQEVSEEMKTRIEECLGETAQPEQIHWQMVTLAMKSVADTAIFPLQDALGLDAAHRMNTPSTMQNNWQWRVLDSQLTPELESSLASLCKSTHR
ncbi:MAG: 4-alpha-glucanotransferase [Candidatus Aceula meridiana]|nr:4-alpha-glucanotransferase [Candidatus Aceula meridiana]